MTPIKVTHPDTLRARGLLATIGPALLGASSFACADVLSKVTLNAGTDVLTMSMARGFIGLAVMFVWLRLALRAARAAAGAADAALEMDIAGSRRSVRRQRVSGVQGDRERPGADRDPHLFRLPAAHRARGGGDRARQADLARRGGRDRGLPRSGADDRRAPRWARDRR